MKTMHTANQCTSYVDKKINQWSKTNALSSDKQ